MSETPLPRMRTKTVVASAPGKILLAGGYLVLEPGNVGLVVAVDKRLYTTVRLLMPENEKSPLPTVPISVYSPQFERTWMYDFHRATLSLSPVLDSSTCHAGGNAFVEKTLRVALLQLHVEPDICEIHATICADSAFYGGPPTQGGKLSNETSVETASVDHIDDRWRPISRPDGTITKTGLGSSACLVTSLVAALCYALNEDAHKQTPEQNGITALSQMAHCYAQGKIGSGFDVSAACHGSHVYRRFPHQALEHVLTRLTSEKVDTGEDSANELRQCVKNCAKGDWLSNCMAGSIHFPPDCLLQVLMADVSGGSESPGMARKVLQWKNNTSDLTHWLELSQINNKIADLFVKLLDCHPTDVERAQMCCSTPDQWREWASLGHPYYAQLYDMNRRFLESRKCLKAMGSISGVSIEPDEQTRLADATMELPGVVAALCPGAGGFDALACIYIQDKGDSVRMRIENFWAQWSHSDIGALDVRGISCGDGVRMESLEDSYHQQ